ncbi:hypothetical protein HDU76_004123 [Blyttiomyces sp. JEL0837]|nr:hypothetical protein HDU76_004123 [Blyttiomyces sp. JEL0837]
MLKPGDPGNIWLIALPNSTNPNAPDLPQYMCDWRIRIHDCLYSEHLTQLYWINIGLLSFTLITATSMLIYRIGWQGQKFFDRVEDVKDIDDMQGHRVVGRARSGSNGQSNAGWNNPSGKRRRRNWLLRYRPRPVENFLLWASIFLVLRIVHSFVVLYDWIDDEMTREWSHDIAWQFGFMAIATYWIGVLYMTPRLYLTQTGTIKGHRTWHPSPIQVTVLHLIFCLGPIVSSIISIVILQYQFKSLTSATPAVPTSIPKDVSTLSKEPAHISIMSHYIMWSTWDSLIVIAFAVFGSKLCGVLLAHRQALKHEIDNNPINSNNSAGVMRNNQLMVQLKRIDMALLRIFGLKWANMIVMANFALAVCCYGVFRVRILVKGGLWAQYTVFGICYFSGAILILAVQAIVLLGSPPTSDCSSEQSPTTTAWIDQTQQQPQDFELQPTSTTSQSLQPISTFTSSKSTATSLSNLSFSKNNIPSMPSPTISIPKSPGARTPTDLGSARRGSGFSALEVLQRPVPALAMQGFGIEEGYEEEEGGEGGGDGNGEEKMDKV